MLPEDTSLSFVSPHPSRTRRSYGLSCSLSQHCHVPTIAPMPRQPRDTSLSPKHPASPALYHKTAAHSDMSALSRRCSSFHRNMDAGRAPLGPDACNKRLPVGDNTQCAARYSTVTSSGSADRPPFLITLMNCLGIVSHLFMLALYCRDHRLTTAHVINCVVRIRKHNIAYCARP